MLSELRSEREAIDEAIIVLERLARGQGKRRGRPPKWMSEARGEPANETEPRKKRVVSAEARARMSAAHRESRVKRDGLSGRRRGLYERVNESPARL